MNILYDISYYARGPVVTEGVKPSLLCWGVSPSTSNPAEMLEGADLTVQITELYHQAKATGTCLALVQRAAPSQPLLPITPPLEVA